MRLVIIAVLLSACDWGFSVEPWPDAAPKDSGSDVTDGVCAQETVTVSIESMTFVPFALTVPLYTRVQWINNDTVIHDVTEGDPSNPKPLFSSGVLAPGASWYLDLCEPASYVYHCAAHPNMMLGATIGTDP